MSNYNDLLYTNKFVNKDNININKFKKSNININQVNKFRKNTINNTQAYLQRNLLTSNEVNLNKFNASQFHSHLNKNSYPILSDAMRDIAEDKYFKIRKTAISIYSGDRNKSIYTSSNNYIFDLQNKFENVQKIKLKDFYFPNSIPPINITNNIFIWGYPTLEELYTTGSDNLLIPTKNNSLLFSDIVDVNNCDYKQLIYSYSFPNTFIDVESFPNYFTSKISQNSLHGIKNLYDPDYIELLNSKENNDNDGSSFIDTKRKFIEKPFSDDDDSKFDKVSNQNIFNINININTHKVELINRLESIPIMSIQTFVNDIDLNKTGQTDRLFSYFERSAYYPLNYILKKNRIYITILIDGNNNYLERFQNNANGGNPYPLVFTNLPSISGIIKEDINYTCFFHEKIYENNYGVIPDYVSTYKLFDRIILIEDYTCPPGIKGKQTVQLLRFELKVSSGNTNNNFLNSSGRIINTIKQENIILNNSLEKFIKMKWRKDVSGCNFNYTDERYRYFVNDIFLNLNESFNESENKLPNMGRAIPFKLYKNVDIMANDDTCSKTNSTILDMLGFITINNLNSEVISVTSEYKFIHSNTQDYLISPFNTINKEDLIKELTLNNSPQNKLNLENYNGKFYFKSIPFIFMKIFPNNTQSVLGQLERIEDNKDDVIEKEYSKIFYLAQNNINRNKKDTDNLFAKIYINQVPLKSVIMNKSTYEFIFEEKPLENFSSLKIVFTNPFGREIELSLEHSFTLEIYEKINVLKDTLLDTRNGDVCSNGIKSLYY